MKDAEYEALLNKYNLAVAQVRDMREQMTTKDRQWKKYEEDCETTFHNMRKLCESILAKDRREMSLGDAKTWYKYTNDEMITKAQKCFIQYNKERTEMQNRIMEIAETRGRQIESLTDQISQILKHGDITANVTVESLLEKADKEKKEKEIASKAPNGLKAAVSEGKVDMVIVDEDDGQVTVDGEQKDIEELMAQAAQAAITPNAIPIARGKAKLDAMKNAEETALAHVVDVRQYMDKCNEAAWRVLEIIGKDGKSKVQEILEIIAHDDTALSSRHRAAMKNLSSMGAIEEAKFSLPLTKKAFFVRLTDIGARMYKEHFGVAAVPSEIELVCKEHDNAEHGYGILDVEQILKESGKYISICSYNRKNPIPVEISGQKLQYIPDIVCKTNKYTEYIEYERGHHTQIDFNIKCNKMCQVTRFLNFVCPNKSAMAKIKTQVDAWIAQRGVDSLKTITIHIGTATGLRDGEGWPIEYHLAIGAEPVKSVI